MIPFTQFYQEYKKINEMTTTGFTTGEPNYTSGFSYSVVPLSFNLQQGNGREIRKKYFSFHVGDTVKGISPINGKEYTGIIKHLYYKDGDNQDEPYYVYILNLEHNNIIPLEVNDKLKKVK